MERLSSKERQQIVRKELKQLVELKYISEAEYTKLVQKHNQLYTSLEQKRAEEKAQNTAMEKEITPEVVTPVPKKVRKTLSPQEVRERNITWSLNLGVILLLIGGLVLATSTWDTLGNWTKTGLIALVSLLFFGLAYFTRQVLKIEKTAFAFHVLGSLFLPIVILSAGYFELFGAYFSFSGEGRYLYSAAGSLIILPIYLLLAIRLTSRLFVWFSYLALSVFVSFMIAALYLPVDGFYLGIMVFNAALIIAYKYLKTKAGFQQFTKEFVAYVQANLILSTLLMLVFYNHEVVHSVNLLLTAALYFAMIFVTKQKEYHFVFSAMLVYGAYQLIEFSALHEVGAMVYALLGFIFILIPMVMPKDFPLRKAFRYTSAVVSALAFLYISFEGILLKMNEPSVVLLIAYVIISLNFTFLTTLTKKRLFTYLSPIFSTVALYELVLIGQELFGYESLNLGLFIASYLFYIFFGHLVKGSFFQRVKESTRDVAAVVMSLCILAGFALVDWWQIGTMLLLISLLAIFADRLETRKPFAENAVASWIHAVTLGSAVAMYYAEVVGSDFNYDFDGPFKAQSFVLAGIIVLLISFLWRRLKRTNFYDNSFYVAQGFYAFGILLTFDNFNASLRVWIVLGGIGMAYLLYKKAKWKEIAYVVSSLSLLFYLTAIYAMETQLDIQSDLLDYVQLVTGALLLLTTGLIIGNRDKSLMKSFWWVGHLYLPFALALSFLFYDENAVWAFGMATILYGVSIYQVKTEWKIKTMLYACFTSFWIVISLSLFLLDVEASLRYAFIITSAAIAILWYVSRGLWTKRIAFYVVPFSVVGIVTSMTVHPYELGAIIVTVIYAIVLLFIMHKERWDMFAIVPLLQIYYAISLFSESNDLAMVLSALFGVILTAIGILLYPSIYQKAKEKGMQYSLDWYSIISLIVFINLYFLTGEALWTKLLPGVLIFIYLVVQRKRIPYVEAKWIVFIACAYLIQPYYAVLGHIQVPELIERELYVLPWIIPAIFLKKVSGQQYKTIVNRIEWAVLLVVSLLLVQDGLASNTIYDALIVGVLALASMLGGMAYQIKSFFFVGAGVLLLNVFLQTRPYWGNLPWWMYLLIAGSILIAVASYNEWHKQKASDGKETLISIFNKKVLQKIKKWD